MFLNYFKILGYFVGGLWTASGGRKRIEAKQLQNLRRLVKKVRKDSPFFQRLYEDLPESSLIELKDLPITDKRKLMADFNSWLTLRTLTLAQARAHMADMKNLGIPIQGVIVFRTSGTSGEPAVIVLPPSHWEYVVGVSLARMGIKQIQLLSKVRKAGASVGISGGSGHFGGVGVTKLFQNLMPRLYRQLDFISAEQPLPELVRQLNDIQNVASIVTYPSVLTMLTKEKEEGRLKVEPLVIKVAGETLTNVLKERAQRAFPSLEHSIINAYASTECLLPAQECSFGRQHVFEDWVILEPVDKNMKPVPDGTLSDKALLTVLSNDVQPFIRYELGDRLRFYRDPCPCGSPFRSFQVEGRQATLVHVGEVSLSPLVFDLEHKRAQRVQLVQVKEEEFEIRVDLFNPEDSDKVFEDLIPSVIQVFQKNGLSHVKVKRAMVPPQLTASGKFCEVLPLILKKNEHSS